MKILITGTSQGIGKAIAELFLKEKHTVIGIDRKDQSIDHPSYTHYVCDDGSRGRTVHRGCDAPAGL